VTGDRSKKMLSYRGIVVILFSLEQGPIRPLASTCYHSETSELCVALSSSLPHPSRPAYPPLFLPLPHPPFCTSFPLPSSSLGLITHSPVPRSKTCTFLPGLRVPCVCVCIYSMSLAKLNSDCNELKEELVNTKLRTRGPFFQSRIPTLMSSSIKDGHQGDLERRHHL